MYVMLQQCINGSFSQELYHQSCMNTCVMFAAIPNFKANETFSAANVTGSECLRLLNEIISAFDMVTKPLPSYGFNVGREASDLSAFILSLYSINVIRNYWCKS